MFRLDNLTSKLLNLKKYVDLVNISKILDPPINFDVSDLISHMCHEQMHHQCEILAEHNELYSQVQFLFFKEK